MCTAPLGLAHGQHYYNCSFETAAWSPDGSAVLLEFVIQPKVPDFSFSCVQRVRSLHAVSQQHVSASCRCQSHTVCAEEALDFQAVCLLEMATLDFQLVWPPEPASSSRPMSFTPDGQQLIVTSPIDGLAWKFWVADRSGQCHSQFAVQAHSVPAWANITHGRIAVAEGPLNGQRRLAARDLSSGQVVVSRELPIFSCCGTFGLAANPGGTKLAACSWETGAVHLYDATTLQDLGCMQQMPGQVGANREARLTAAIWGTYGWLLSSHDCPQPLLFFGCGPSQPHKPGALHVWRPQQGHTLAEVLYTGLQQQSALALSPDGAFVCIYAAAEAVLRVHDVRSGHLVLEQETGLPVIPRYITTQTRHNSFAVWWGGCGRLNMIQHTCCNHKGRTTPAAIRGWTDVSLYVLPVYL